MHCALLKMLILEQLIEIQQNKCSDDLHFNFFKFRVGGISASDGLNNFFPLLVIMHSLSSVPQLLPKQNSADTSKQKDFGRCSPRAQARNIYKKADIASAFLSLQWPEF